MSSRVSPLSCLPQDHVGKAVDHPPESSRLQKIPAIDDVMSLTFYT